MRSINSSMEYARLVVILSLTFTTGYLIPSVTSIYSRCFFSLSLIALGYAAVVTTLRLALSLELEKRKPKRMKNTLEVW